MSNVFCVGHSFQDFKSEEMICLKCGFVIWRVNDETGIKSALASLNGGACSERWHGERKTRMMEYRHKGDLFHCELMISNAKRNEVYKDEVFFVNETPALSLANCCGISYSLAEEMLGDYGYSPDPEHSDFFDFKIFANEGSCNGLRFVKKPMKATNAIKFAAMNTIGRYILCLPHNFYIACVNGMLLDNDYQRARQKVVSVFEGVRK